ncbi:MAG: sensor histidine kinase [Eubacteriales bacterium]|nr:sensor histidine kinase [Eubacteriales bacterium]
MKKRRFFTEEELNRMIEEQVARALEKENHEFEREMLLKQANLATLQSQINPHFLYNTLECIRGMALLNDQEDIANIAWSLSRFFRYSISGTSDTVSLSEELENVRYYTTIQNYRFRDRFAVVIESDPAIEDAMLPKMTLQPVMENAILHGLADVLEGGRITVKTGRINSNVRILISDNGCGMTPEQLDALVRRIHEGKAKEGEEGRHTGIGMRNVDRRLKLHFGPEYGISIYSCKDIGTDVEIRIPYRPFVMK